MHKYSAKRLPFGDRRDFQHVGFAVLHPTYTHDVCQPYLRSALAAEPDCAMINHIELPSETTFLTGCPFVRGSAKPSGLGLVFASP